MVCSPCDLTEQSFDGCDELLGAIFSRLENNGGKPVTISINRSLDDLLIGKLVPQVPGIMRPDSAIITILETAVGILNQTAEVDFPSNGFCFYLQRPFK